MTWYPENKNELNGLIDSFLKNKKGSGEKVNGIIVPHAGYEYSGEIAGKAYNLLPKKKKAVVIGPSHYISFRGVRLIHKDRLTSPLGKMKTIKTNYKEINVPEHSVLNQIPFLQKLGFSEIIPMVVGKIDKKEARKIAEDLAKEKDCVFVFSTDLSHFFDYEKAFRIDKNSIKIMEDLEIGKWGEIDACGAYPLLILFELCKIKGWKPKLIEYKNSGDVTGLKESVVGYAGFWF